MARNIVERPAVRGAARLDKFTWTSVRAGSAHSTGIQALVWPGYPPAQQDAATDTPQSKEPEGSRYMVTMTVAVMYGWILQ